MPVTAIEVAGETSTYQWNKVNSGSTFPRRTLFPEADGNAIALRALELRLRRALDEAGPAAVAIPGWSDPAALIALKWGLDHRIPVIVMSAQHGVGR